MLRRNDYTLEGVRTSCSICWQDRSANVISYNVMMFVFAYVVPLLVMIYCYTCIYLRVSYTPWLSRSPVLSVASVNCVGTTSGEEKNHLEQKCHGSEEPLETTGS